MEQNIIKLQNRADFGDVKVIFCEDEYTDNCYYMIQVNNIKIGISYYDLGVRPAIKVIYNTIFIGFGNSILIYDYVEEKLIYHDIDPLHIVYEVKFIEDLNYVLFICELKLLCFDLQGVLVWENGFYDLIKDWKIQKNNIILYFNNNKEFEVSIKSGNAKY